MNFAVDLCCQFCGGRLNEEPDHVEINKLQPEEPPDRYRIYDEVTMGHTMSSVMYSSRDDHAYDALRYSTWAARSAGQWDGRINEVATAEGAREFLDRWGWDQAVPNGEIHIEIVKDDHGQPLVVDDAPDPWWKFW
jgi:hypothetical protein